VPRSREPTITVHPPIEIKPAELPAEVRIRCIYESRLIVGEDKTASGRRYEFNTGEVKPVDLRDYFILLGLETKPSGCCGGTVRPQKYFEEVF